MHIFPLIGDAFFKGEAAGLVMGLVMVGSSDPRAIDKMVEHSKETQHEKILRGLAVGIALVPIGRNLASLDLSPFFSKIMLVQDEFFRS